MAQKIKLKFGTEYFPLTKGSYTLTLQNKETKNETEAGTIIRDIKRTGIPHLSISSSVDNTWYQKLEGYYVSGSKITVYYYSPVTLAEASFDGFIENLSFNLVKDNGTSPRWEASFEVTSY